MLLLRFAIVVRLTIKSFGTICHAVDQYLEVSFVEGAVLRVNEGVLTLLSTEVPIAVHVVTVIYLA